MPTGYTANLVEGKIKSFDEFAATCARAFFYDCEKLPLNAKELLKKQDPRDYDGDIKELEEQYNKANNHEAYLKELEKQKAFCEESIAEGDKTNARINDMLNQVMSWYPKSLLLDSLKKFMIEQLEASKENTEYAAKRLRHINDIIRSKNNDPETFNLNFIKSMKSKKKVIDDTRHLKENNSNIELEVQNWLDAFYSEFPSLLEKKEEKKKEEKKKE